MSDIEARFCSQKQGFSLDINTVLPGKGITGVFGTSGSGKTRDGQRGRRRRRNRRRPLPEDVLLADAQEDGHDRVIDPREAGAEIYTDHGLSASDIDPDAAKVREERLRRSRADAIAPLCVFLASEDAANVTGQVFHQRAAELSLYSQPRPLRMVHQKCGWTPETIRDVGMPSLAINFLEIANSRAVHPGLPLD